MELRQLRYFVRVVETGSISRAAKDFGVVTSALSQQLSRLEGELSTRLLYRSATGVKATDAGMAFYRQAQLALRHTNDAVIAAQQARLSGHVSVGMASSTSAILAVPFVTAMRHRYPDIRIHLVESLSTNLVAMLNARQLDLAVLFEGGPIPRWGALPLVEERLFLIGLRDMPALAELQGSTVRLSDLAHVPLVLGSQGMRVAVDAAFARARCEPNILLEVDGLAVLMDMVCAGIAATIQSGAATTRLTGEAFKRFEIADQGARRRTVLSSLSDNEMSPAALAARNVLSEAARTLVDSGQWPGAGIHVE
ncbi:LysR family transcriptional regulator [Ramlibacter sp. 2FC]|uniref:LysR family transcriptional regulator n=1 Tax=Ramlibacter sp. 2FC TaxID=2502188 RepID=UPI0010F7D0EC|nr:LysR family transcriptional regulator [Ramlibacter sp. 2FC]